MPVILDAGSDKMKTWLDPGKTTWTEELQSLLQPFQGELDCYPVSKDVGKVGNNSPSFIIPINSKENKNNIANFFGKSTKTGTSPQKTKDEIKGEKSPEKQEVDKPTSTPQAADTRAEEQLPLSSMHPDQDSTPIKTEPTPSPRGQKRHPSSDGSTTSPHARSPPAAKALKTESMPTHDVVADVNASISKMSSPTKTAGRPTRSATSNGSVANKNNLKSPAKNKAEGNQKITSFFGK
jgi:hypothetical protein